MFQKQMCTFIWGIRELVDKQRIELVLTEEFAAFVKLININFDVFRESKITLSKNAFYYFVINGSLESQVTVIEDRLASITVVTCFWIAGKAMVKGLQGGNDVFQELGGCFFNWFDKI